MQYSDLSDQPSVIRPLFQLKDELTEALYQGHSHTIIWPTLKRLEQYAQGNANELHHWLITKFECQDKTRQHYQQLIRQIQDWADDYHTGCNILTAEIIHFIRRWTQL